MKSHDTIKNMIVLAMLGALLFASKIAFEALPNIHPTGALIMVITIVYRYKALIPIYLFVILLGLYYGFPQWWIPYIYIWTILWGLTMLVPERLNPKLKGIVYPIVCGLHGLSYGVLYSPVQALLYSYNLKTTIAWIVSGLPFDLIHCAGNFAMGIVVYPLVKVIKKVK